MIKPLISIGILAAAVFSLAVCVGQIGAMGQSTAETSTLIHVNDIYGYVEETEIPIERLKQQFGGEMKKIQWFLFSSAK